MKVYMKPIKVRSDTTFDGTIIPLKFKMLTEEKELITIKIDGIDDFKEEKIAGNRMFVYKCNNVSNGILKIFEIKYEVNTCKWFLFKM